MAIYHFSAQVISRSQGRSSVASAAYRAAERLLDERVGIAHDFTKKRDVLEKAILLPEGAPGWMGDREKLWNAIESISKRKDAQLSREINVSLPYELSYEQNWTLVQDFVKKAFVEKGMVADITFHRGHKGNEDQPHAHIMLTMREILPEGFGQKMLAWDRRELLKVWREQWAEHCNLELLRQGFDRRIDHRTLKAQGIDLEPQHKIGPKAAQASMARLKDHQAIARRNGERLLEAPGIALEALIRQQSTFTHEDLARFVHRNTEDAAQFKGVYETVKAHPDLVYLGKDDHERDRYTTKEMLALERRMVGHARALVNGSVGVRKSLQRLLSVTSNFTDQQTKAFEYLTGDGDIHCLVGYAGTGKSYLLGLCREAWEKEGYRVRGATLSGIAAENLEMSSGIESRTLASCFYYWDKGEQLLTTKDILVIDEAGMIGSCQMARVLEEVQKQGAKVMLVGDPEQLQAIEAGAAFRALSEVTGFIEINEIYRQLEGWQREATGELARGLTETALGRYREQGHVHTFETQAMAQKAMVEQWHEGREKTQILLAYTRKEVQALNDRVRALRHALGELEEEVCFSTSRGERLLSCYDRIYFLQNDRALGVKNGTLGTIINLQGKNLTVQLDGGRLVTVDIEQYPYIDHGYAATIHKAQGITVDRSHILASEYFDRHSTYVAMSRHREKADLYFSREAFGHFTALGRTLSRARSKDVTLDYTQDESFTLNPSKKAL